MLVPFVLPEGLVIAIIVLPVCVHVGQELVPALLLEDGGDVGELSRGVAEFLVCAITIVGPDSVLVNPGIDRWRRIVHLTKVRG